MKQSQNFEDILLKFYEDEFNKNKIEYNFNPSSRIKLTKLENYVNAINDFFKFTSNSENEAYLKIDKILNNKIYFKKSNGIITYRNLSIGEKKFLDESIYLFNIIQNKNLKINDLSEFMNLKKASISNQKYEKNLKSNPNLNKKYWDNKNNISDVSLINKIYFIDELELGFHPIWLSNILNFLKTSLKNINGQIFIATHSEIIPYTINIETDTLINMNDPNKNNIISFKNYKSIQDFVNQTLYVNYMSFIDESNVWVEGRTDKAYLEHAIKLNLEEMLLPFNILCTNNLILNSKDKSSNDTEQILNSIINGASNIQTQFWSWIGNVEYQYKKPVFFILDNDEYPDEKNQNGSFIFQKIEAILINDKNDSKSWNLELTETKYGDYLINLKIERICNDIFIGYKIHKNIKHWERETNEIGYLLTYKEMGYKIESFIKDSNLKKEMESEDGKKDPEKFIKNRDYDNNFKNDYYEYLKVLRDLQT